MVFRLHHAMGDGAALMGVTMAMVDGPVGDSRRPPPPDEDEGWLQILMAPVVAAINAGAQASTSILGTAFGLPRHPLRAAGLLRDGVGVAGELGWLLAMPSDSATRFKGQPKGSKRVAWCEPLKLPEVKAVSRRTFPPYSMERISISWSPAKTTSPAALPIRARATGETYEIDPFRGSASSSPTIRKASRLPSSRLNVT